MAAHRVPYYAPTGSGDSIGATDVAHSPKTDGEQLAAIPARAGRVIDPPIEEPAKMQSPEVKATGLSIPQLNQESVKDMQDSHPSRDAAIPAGAAGPHAAHESSKLEAQSPVADETKERNKSALFGVFPGRKTDQATSTKAVETDRRQSESGLHGRGLLEFLHRKEEAIAIPEGDVGMAEYSADQEHERDRTVGRRKSLTSGLLSRFSHKEKNETEISLSPKGPETIAQDKSGEHAGANLAAVDARGAGGISLSQAPNHHAKEHEQVGTTLHATDIRKGSGAGDIDATPRNPGYMGGEQGAPDLEQMPEERRKSLVIDPHTGLAMDIRKGSEAGGIDGNPNNRGLSVA